MRINLSTDVFFYRMSLNTANKLREITALGEDLANLLETSLRFLNKPEPLTRGAADLIRESVEVLGRLPAIVAAQTPLIRCSMLSQKNNIFNGKHCMFERVMM
jgi:hypothetical protein